MNHDVVCGYLERYSPSMDFSHYVMLTIKSVVVCLSKKKKALSCEPNASGMEISGQISNVCTSQDSTLCFWKEMMFLLVLLQLGRLYRGINLYLLSV